MGTLLIVDPQVAGASGDMLLGGLLDAGADEGSLRRVVRSLRDRGFRVGVDVSRVSVRGFRAVRVRVDAGDRVGDPDRLEGLVLEVAGEVVTREPWSELPERALRLLLRAEERVHGRVNHLHELGSVDTVVDLVGTAALLEDLDPGRALVLPPNVGSGTVSTEHGELPVPVPAVAEILSGWERGFRADGEGELLTPTGAALLRAIDELTEDAEPPWRLVRQGFGAGSRELKDRPNVLRILLCEPGGEGGFVRVVETSIDDADGEAVGEAISRLLELDGVRDVEVLHGLGKKNRPRFILRAIVEDRPGVEREVFREIFRWTGSLGARVYRCERVVADRRLVREDGVRVKRSRFEDVEHAKPEWEDVRERVGHRSSLLVRAELLARSRRRDDD